MAKTAKQALKLVEKLETNHGKIVDNQVKVVNLIGKGKDVTSTVEKISALINTRTELTAELRAFLEAVG